MTNDNDLIRRNDLIKAMERVKKYIHADYLHVVDEQINAIPVIKAESVQISRSALTEFCNMFCLNKPELVACAESAFDYFNKNLIPQDQTERIKELEEALRPFSNSFEKSSYDSKYLSLENWHNAFKVLEKKE